MPTFDNTNVKARHLIKYKSEVVVQQMDGAIQGRVIFRFLKRFEFILPR